MMWRLLEPFAELTDLRRQLDRFVDRVSTETGLWRAGAFPALNVWEDGDNVYAEAELPGLTGQDVEITVNGNELTVKGGCPAGEDKSVTYHRRERANSEFSRTVTLPYEIDQENVRAQMHDGILNLTLPKAAKLKARKIEVKVA